MYDGYEDLIKDVARFLYVIISWCQEEEKVGNKINSQVRRAIKDFKRCDSKVAAGKSIYPSLAETQRQSRSSLRQ